MPTNSVSQSDIISISAPAGGCVSGDIVVIGALFGVAQATVAAGELVALWREDVWDFKKTGAEVFAVGAVAKWDVATKRILIAGALNVGVVVKAATATDTTVRVALYNQ